MTPAPYHLVRDGGGPLRGAAVVFIAADGSVDAERTDTHGDVAPRVGFVAVRIRLAGRSDEPEVSLTSSHTVVLPATLTTVGRVSVATGSDRSLHQLPVPASVLDRAALARTPAQTSDEVLRALPGFDRGRSNSGFTNYGQLRVSLNGAGNDRGRVLTDGVPAQDGFGGQVDWLAYPAGDLIRAELLRGAGSALYGSGAIGGTLALTTFGPGRPGTAPEGDFGYTLGTRATRAISTRYRARIAGRLSASASLEERHQSYADLPPGYASPLDTPATSDSSATHLRARYDLGDVAAIEVGTIQAYDDQEEGRPNYRFGRTFGQYDIAATFGRGDTSARVGAFARDTSVVNVADQYPAKPGALRYVQNVPTYESGASGSYVRQLGQVALEAVADERFVRGTSVQTGTTGAFQSSGSGEQRDTGAALQATYRRERFEALAGARADSVDFTGGTLLTATTHTAAADRTDRAVSPRLALRYDVAPNVALRGSIAGAFRAPYLNELVRGYQIGSVAYAPNVGLIPERSESRSGGVDVALRGGRLSVDYTRTTVNDAIAFVTQSATLQQRQNVARTRTDGVTATYDASLGQCVRVRLGATSQNARIVAGPAADVGKALAFVPNGAATIGIDAQTGRTSYGIQADYVGGTYADDLQTQPLAPAVLLGARIAVPLGGAVFTAFGENLSDRRYRSSIDRYGPPSTIGLRASVPLGRVSDVLQPACDVRS